MKRERQPTLEELEKLLVWFDPDRDKAGEIFSLIHSRLIKIFTLRGCVDAEALADEVLNRVAVRIDTLTQNYSDPRRCCLGFVENVYREYERERRNMQNTKEFPPPDPPDLREKEDECLKQCLEWLTEAERDFFVRYFNVEKRDRIIRRRKLAEEMAINLNALRIRAHHVRKKMHECMMKCLTDETVRD